MEYCAKGNMYDYISNLKSFTHPIARFYFSQILDALETIHTAGFYHGDIKLENILLDEQFDIKITDFGFSGINTELLNRHRGTIGYMTPEILARRNFSGQAYDIFAACVVLYMLITGHRPFMEASSTDLHYKMIKEEKFVEYFRSMPHENLNADLKSLFWKAF